MNKKVNETNRERVASLFKKRTGIKYQNWIQAWSVTLKKMMIAS